MPVIGLIAVTGGGRGAAERLAAAWPGQTRMYDGPARQALARAWAQCDGLVCFLAVGATVRLISPLLNSKWTDPAVVCVDESARRAVAVVGGHAAGANALATRVAEVFGADAVITTATDAVSLPGLDTLGWPTEGAIGTVSRALLDGERVRLESAETWPLPPLPATVGDTGEYRILISDRLAAGDPHTAVLRPPSLVVGVYLATLEAGYEAGVDEVLRLADGALGEAGLSAASVATLAAVSENGVPLPGIAAAARERGWPLVSYPAAQLTGTPGGDGAKGGDGTSPGWAVAAPARPSAAGAAALAGAVELMVAERQSRDASVAVARIRPRGRLALVGTGPGARDLLTPRATSELRRASVVAGPGAVLEQVADLLRSGTRVIRAEPGEEEARGREAVWQARQGHAAAVVFPADPGLHPLAGLLQELAGDETDVVRVPGVVSGWPG
jgi:cobalt-precorrin 5A hydrolase/precorrin-3B C17-methyltransferase